MQSKPHMEELNREREKEKRRNDKGTNVTTPVENKKSDEGVVCSRNPKEEEIRKERERRGETSKELMKTN